MRRVGIVKILPEEKIFKLLKIKNRTIALAESCTGGLASSRLTDVSGISEFFKGGVVAYSNDVKISLLGVSVNTIGKSGAVSGKTARDMAEGVRGLMGADVAAAITGIAGPSGGTRKKPVGLAYIAFAHQGKAVSKKIIATGSRTAVKKKFTDALLVFVSGKI
jgi:PncC family amidohydrolase